jgi:hypothetical protein
MPIDLHEVFEAVKPVFSNCAPQLRVTTDSDEEYSLDSTVPSLSPQHKGKPMFFGAVRIGKRKVSLHLMPIYTDPELIEGISDGLKKRMQGKSCFNFSTVPAPELFEELSALVNRSFEQWSASSRA